MSPRPYEFGSKLYRTNIPESVKFELKSLFGRAVLRPRAPVKKYIQIGAGETLFDDFENLDFYRFRPHRSANKRIGHDLRYPLPYTDDTFWGAYSEHTLEHLYPDQAVSLLKEVRRILKPGSVFRCAVPDLKKYVDFYIGKDVDEEFKKFENGCEAIWCLTQNWGHLSVWDASMLSKKMFEAGFKKVTERNYQDGENGDLLKDQETRRWETMYVEAVR